MRIALKDAASRNALAAEVAFSLPAVTLTVQSVPKLNSIDMTRRRNPARQLTFMRFTSPVTYAPKA